MRTKKPLSQELALDDDRVTSLQLIDFLFIPELQFFVLVYPSKICFFDRDAILKLQETRMRHMNVFLKGIKTLTKGNIIKQENKNFLLLTTKVRQNQFCHTLYLL